VILVAGRLLFDVPMVGSVCAAVGGDDPVHRGQPGIGFTFSTLARNQLQAMQLTFFFFLPSMLLSGFMFPFRGMPGWAQNIGEALPLTHFLRIVRGIMLKGNTASVRSRRMWPIALFMLVAGALPADARLKSMVIS
jgi:ABC-2 type transport system permease protein